MEHLEPNAKSILFETYEFRIEQCPPLQAAEGRLSHLPSPHEEGEVPGHNSAHHPNRLVKRVTKIGTVDGNGLAADLVGPARK